MRDVLVVEDDRVVLSAVAGVCRSEGLEVDETINVEEAVARLYGSSYRLAIVDLMLPQESGFSLLRGARAARRAKATVVISGYATTLSALESFQLGAFDFLPKPFDVAELLGVVRRALRCEERRDAGEPVGQKPAEGTRYSLGRHSWATLDADRVATIGAAETFQDVLTKITQIELPTPSDHVTQGQRLARLEAENGETYRVWSPLSGRVVEANDEVRESPDLVGRSPFDRGWLARLTPLDLEGEGRRLDVCRADGE